MPDAPDLSTAIVAARAADDKGAQDVVVLDVGPVLAVCEHFVIASGTNTRQVRTIADEVQDQVRLQCNVKPLRTEGVADAQWILLDYGDVVVHVFLDETRRYYDLERLWADVDQVSWAAAAGAAVGAPADLEGSDAHP